MQVFPLNTRFYKDVQVTQLSKKLMQDSQNWLQFKQKPRPLSKYPILQSQVLVKGFRILLSSVLHCVQVDNDVPSQSKQFTLHSNI